MPCLSPLTVTKDDKSKVIVPCGKCPECKIKRASAWSFRLMQEEKVCSSAWFITLTYDNGSVKLSPNRFMTLCKSDLQKFFKRLRKLHTKFGYKEKLKYYAVGEYGSDTKRPHYHAILFNANVELIEMAWSLDGIVLGAVHFGQVSEASVGYTLKYICKPAWKRMHKNDDRAPEFSVMSKGLGKNYLTPSIIRWHLADRDNRMYCTYDGGKKMSMPRYYKDKIYTEQQRQAIAEHFRVQYSEETIKKLLTCDPVKYLHAKKSAITASYIRQKRVAKDNIKNEY